MLWLGLYFPQLPLEVFVRGRQQAGALAVVDTQGGREQVSRCDAAAQAYGVRPGQALPAALALCADLAVQRRERDRERRALDELAAWAYQFSARIAFEPSLLLLEVGASRRLFGGLPVLLQTLRRELGQLGYDAAHALAPTPAAAGLLARSRPGSEVLTCDDLRAAVAPLSLACLTRDRRARELVRHIGLDTLGDVLALPRPELARRVGGPRFAALLDRVLGDAPDPRAEWSPPARFAQTVELLGEIGQTTALVFPARRLMVALCGFLRGLGGGAQRLQWTLQHRDHPATAFDQGLLDPSRDPDHMLEMFRERIERLSLPASVIAITLRVDDWQAFVECNLALPVGDVAAVPDPALLERLANRLGEHCVRGLRCLADHRPERAWRLCRPGEADDEEAGGSVPAATAHGLSQPPWLLPQPRPLRDCNGVPEYGGVLRLEGLPERIEAGWWDGFDITRDYFVAHSPAGERLWVFRDRRGGGWYLHGLFV
ncbi:MAG: DNA polymerase Y family protein [Gammaproteobacteria bacterium]|nr:DNA polymerase Y family protein [Gammaproteobacteria bacterium]